MTPYGVVRFTPESGHMQCTRSCLLCANSGHEGCVNAFSYDLIYISRRLILNAILPVSREPRRSAHEVDNF
jgi:hypothetical protein